MVKQGKARTHNVPLQLTSLIGREQEIRALCTSLLQADTRLVTLTGPGGVGKTRLSLQVANELLGAFEDGVYFIPLAPVSDPDLVVTTICWILGMKESGKQSPVEMVEAALQDKQMLLILDNFEQLLPAVSTISAFLAACPHLKILVTSRAVLHVRGEYEFPVQPLEVPGLSQLPGEEALSKYASVALFMERARAVKPDFRMTATNASTIAEICVRLEGLPLALELAAARIKILPPSALLRRLERRLVILTGRKRDIPAHQQTLRTTIAWSYDLLDAEEQRLFRCLSAFAEGCTLEAIESVYEALYGESSLIFDAITSLVDKSLLYARGQDDEEPRLVMMGIIRDYGLEVLADSGEMEKMRREHALYYLRLAERAETELVGSQQAQWSEHLGREYDNLRSALEWLLKQTEEPTAPSSSTTKQELALRLVGSLSWLWWVHGRLTEGRNFLERALAANEESAMSVTRARVLFSTANIAFVQGDYERTAALAEKSLALYRQIDNKRGIALALDPLGNVAWLQGDMAQACALKEEALSLYRELGDTGYVALSLFSLGLVASSQGKYTRAQAYFEESLLIERTLQNKRGIAHVLSQLAQLLFAMQLDLEIIQPLIEESLQLSQEIGFKEGIAAYHCVSAQLVLAQKDLPAAEALAKRSATLYEEIGHLHGVAKSLAVLGKVAATEGNYKKAQMHFEQCLAITNGLGEKWVAGVYLIELGQIMAAQQQPVWAAQLWGASQALRDMAGIPIPSIQLADYEQAVSTVSTCLGKKRLADVWAQGRSMTPEQVLTAKGQNLSTPQSLPETPARTYPEGLTAREVEVLCLLASGLTDLKIAEKLVLSPRTVHTHISSIYTKLGVTSRSAATRYAIEHHLT